MSVVTVTVQILWTSDGPIECAADVKPIYRIVPSVTWRDPPRWSEKLGLWTKIKRVTDRKNPGTGCDSIIVAFDTTTNRWSKRLHDRASQAPSE